MIDSKIYIEHTNKLKSILLEIEPDNEVSDSSITKIKQWLSQNADLSERHPFCEIQSKLNFIISHKHMPQDSLNDLIWVCKNITSNSNYHNLIKSDIQKLHKMLEGFLKNNKMTAKELSTLRQWLESSEHLASTYPYDEIYSIIKEIFKVQKLDENEEKYLKLYLSQFTGDIKDEQIESKNLNKLKHDISKTGVCSAEPIIIFKNSIFCFTGESDIASNEDIAEQIEILGGRYDDYLNEKTDYLIVGSDSNPCWTFACYGQKIEKAITLRKEGYTIQIIHENSFWDAVIESE